LGLLHEASRTEGRYRLYKREETIRRLKEILRLKTEGLSLEEVRKIIDRGNKLEMPNIYMDTKAQKAIGVFKEYPVKFAYLFGSYAAGGITNLSDIDIAVFLDEDLNSHKRFDLRLQLIGHMIRVFGTDKIDLIILNDSPLLLSFNVISNGVILYSSDEKRRVMFETRIMSMYFDQEYYYRRHAKFTIDRIASEGIL